MGRPPDVRVTRLEAMESARIILETKNVSAVIKQGHRLRDIVANGWCEWQTLLSDLKQWDFNKFPPLIPHKLLLIAYAKRRENRLAESIINEARITWTPEEKRRLYSTIDAFFA